MDSEKSKDGEIYVLKKKNKIETKYKWIVEIDANLLYIRIWKFKSVSRW